jgi:hypothetical protein
MQTESQLSAKDLFKLLNLTVSTYEKLGLPELKPQTDVYSIQPWDLFEENFDFKSPDYEISPIKTESLYKTGEIWQDVNSKEIYLYLGKKTDNFLKDILLILKGEEDEIGLVIEVTIGKESHVFLNKRLFPR